MAKAYLLLLNFIDNENIYIDHKRNNFIVSLSSEYVVLSCEEVKDFLTIFGENINEVLKENNIKWQ